MVPVVLRPYSGEILYSWLARTAAVYGVDHSGLLGFPTTPWDLLAAPAPETLRSLAEFTRMPETALADLTIAGTDLPQALVEHPPDHSRPVRPQHGLHVSSHDHILQAVLVERLHHRRQ